MEETKWIFWLTQWFHYPKNSLCFAYSPLSPMQHLATTHLFSVSIDLLFPGVHIIRIIQYEDFSDCRLSLGKMHLSFLNVFLHVDSSFIFLTLLYFLLGKASSFPPFYMILVIGFL